MIVDTVSADIRGAGWFVHRLDVPLRTLDAINVAIARRVGAMLATFDVEMAQAARPLALPTLSQ